MIYPDELDFLLCFALELDKHDENENIRKYVKTDKKNEQSVEIIINTEKESLRIKIFFKNECIFDTKNENVSVIKIFSEQKREWLTAYIKNHDYDCEPIIELLLEPVIRCRTKIMYMDSI